MEPKQHGAGCPLDPKHWLLHAVAACTRASGGGYADGLDENADRLAVASLLNALEHFTEQDLWRETTLLEVALYATLMGDKFDGLCTCPEPFTRTDWP